MATPLTIPDIEVTLHVKGGNVDREQPIGSFPFPADIEWPDPKRNHSGQGTTVTFRFDEAKFLSELARVLREAADVIESRAA
ncbi:hypothetical protein ACWHA6_36260 [Streptomyces anthocyanicus]